MQFGVKHKLGVSGILMLLAMAVLAMSVAFYAIPALSRSSGVDQSTMTWVVAGICFVIAVVATRWGKTLSKKGRGE